MKIYFNSTFIERERITDDLWVKGNNGNRIEAYFDDLDLSNVNISLRLVIGWSNGETTNELPMNKSFDNQYAYINLPDLKHDGNTQFIIKIYQNGTLLQTAIFTRNIKATVETNDNTNINTTEYQGLLNQIQDIDDKSNSNSVKIQQLQESINAYEGVENDQIQVLVQSGNKIQAILKDGSITYEKLSDDVKERIAAGGGGSNEPSNNTTCAISVKQIVVDEFSALETDKSPYTHYANVTITSLSDTTGSIALINDNPVLFSKHGFAIASVNGSVVELYSIGIPEEDITLTFELVQATQYCVEDETLGGGAE